VNAVRAKVFTSLCMILSVPFNLKSVHQTNPAMATFTPPSLHAVARTAFALLVFALMGSAYGQTPGSARGKPDVSESYLRQMSVNAAGYCPSQGGSRAYENIKNVSWEILGNQIAFTVEIFIANPLNCQSGKPCPSYDPSPEHVNG
jgi:hypothetical protein